MAKQPVVLYEKRLNGRVVVITLNRPEVRNAISHELRELVDDSWRRFRDDDEAWVAILTGAGDIAFSAGADLKEEALIATGQLPPFKRPHYRPLGLLCEMLDLWKPTIAAINGYALAGGWRLAQECDIRIAAEHAELGISETRWNLGAGWVHTLTRQMHLQHALEVCIWGEHRITAQRAYEMGWVNRVVPKERLMDEAMTWAEQILSLGQKSVRNIKEVLYRGWSMSPLEGAAFARAIEETAEHMEDSIEGRRAFTEKRKPEFRNR